MQLPHAMHWVRGDDGAVGSTQQLPVCRCSRGSRVFFLHRTEPHGLNESLALTGLLARSSAAMILIHLATTGCMSIFSLSLSEPESSFTGDVDMANLL